jgi:hypothetical protein
MAVDDFGEASPRGYGKLHGPFSPDRDVPKRRNPAPIGVFDAGGALVLEVVHPSFTFVVSAGRGQLTQRLRRDGTPGRLRSFDVDAERFLDRYVEVEAGGGTADGEAGRGFRGILRWRDVGAFRADGGFRLPSSSPLIKGERRPRDRGRLPPRSYGWTKDPPHRSFQLCADRGICGLKRGVRPRSGASTEADEREQGEEARQAHYSAADGHRNSTAFCNCSREDEATMQPF